MDPSCVRQDLLPGASRLFADYLYHFDKVEQFYSGGEPSLEHVAQSAKGLSFPDDRRTAVVAALRQQNGDIGALHKLAEPRTVAVVTGQQVGLFSGPAYTIFKALTAVRLARAVEERGIPAVPVFWLATEDHDLAEVDHAWFFGAKAAPVKIANPGLTATGGPVGATPLGDFPLAELQEALKDLPFAEEVLAKLATAYEPNKTLGEAFTTFLKDVLQPFGLVFLDPLHSEIREIAAPFLLQAAERAPELVGLLRERSDALEAAGYHAQVLVEKDASLLFLLNGKKRTSLRWKDAEFVLRDGSGLSVDLEKQAASLSPNALLRPVMQDFLLPTAAYVAGPAEIAYFAQSSVVYDKLLGRMPVIFPRNSFTLLDSRAEKSMTKSRLRFTDLLHDRESVKARIAAKMIPGEVSLQFSSAERTLAKMLTELERSLTEMDPTLAAAAKKSCAKMLYQLKKLERKTARESMRRDEKAASDADYLSSLVFPNKRLQERLYSIVPFLAKHGLDLPERLYAETQLSCPDHMLRSL